MDRLLSELGAALERTGEYRILRRIHPREWYSDLPEDGPTRIGLVVDTEATGLDASKDEPIELAMVKFTYGDGGRIGRVLETYFGTKSAVRSNSRRGHGHHRNRRCDGLGASDRQRAGGSARV